MNSNNNKGFDPAVINEYRAKMKATGRNFLLVEGDDNNSDEYQHFYFVGKFEGREVIYDAALYTLRLHHQSELFEIAEHKAAKHFPQYKKIMYNEDENGNLQPLDGLEEEIGLFIAEVIMEMEEEGDVRVREHVDLDSKAAFGIGLDAGLNVESITPKVIEKLIGDFNDDTLQLDDTLMSFETQQEADTGN